MTQLDEVREDAPTPEHRRPRTAWIVFALAIVFALVGLSGGAYQSKLSDVQKNDNSSFLPSSADSTKVYNASQKFNSIQTIPGFVVYTRPGGLTAADKQKIESDVTKF